MRKISSRQLKLETGPPKLTGRHILDLAHDEHAVLAQHLTKHDVLAVEEGCRCRGDEELFEAMESASAFALGRLGARSALT